MIIIGLNGGIGCGKSTVTERLVCEHDFQALAFADPLWAMLACIGVDTDRVQSDRQYKDHHVLPEIGRTPRELIQTLGTEWGRQMVHPDLWVILAQQQLDALQRLHGPVERVVFSDVRFDNEAAFIHRLGGEVWHIARPRADAPAAHASERGISTKFINRGIVNDGTLERLQMVVDLRVAQLLEGKGVAA